MGKIKQENKKRKKGKKKRKKEKELRKKERKMREGKRKVKERGPHFGSKRGGCVRGGRKRVLEREALASL